MGKNLLGFFDSGDIENLEALIGKLAESSFDYFKLEGDGVKIVIGKAGALEVSESGAASAQTDAIVEIGQPSPGTLETAVIAESAPEKMPLAPEKAEAVAEQAGEVVVRSPSWGLFYAQSEPGAPPYVKVGDKIKKGATIGLVEIMKTYNAIVSEVDGEIIAIHVKNEEQLEPFQPLVTIRVK